MKAWYLSYRTKYAAYSAKQNMPGDRCCSPKIHVCLRSIFLIKCSWQWLWAGFWCLSDWDTQFVGDSDNLQLEELNLTDQKWRLQKTYSGVHKEGRQSWDENQISCQMISLGFCLFKKRGDINECNNNWWLAPGHLKYQTALKHLNEIYYICQSHVE